MTDVTKLIEELDELRAKATQEHLSAAIEPGRGTVLVINERSSTVATFHYTIGDEGVHNARLYASLHNAYPAMRDAIRDRDAEIERLKVYEPQLLLSSTPHDIKVTVAKEMMANLTMSFDALNGDANYSETEITSSITGKTYFVTVHRGDKPTPHQLRKKADDELERLKAACIGENGLCRLCGCDPVAHAARCHLRVTPPAAPQEQEQRTKERE